MRRRPLHVPLLLLVLLLGACATRAEEPGAAPSAPLPAPATAPPSTPGPSALPGPVTVVRTGGIAGLRDTVVVRPDGSWRRTAATGRGTGGTGRLTAVDLGRFDTLAADPRLAAEAGRTAVPGTCADAFSYQVEVGLRTVRFVECPRGPGQPVVAAAIAAFVLAATER